jgi:hypothetical protein
MGTNLWTDSHHDLPLAFSFYALLAKNKRSITVHDPCIQSRSFPCRNHFGVASSSGLYRKRVLRRFCKLSRLFTGNVLIQDTPDTLRV